MSGTQEEHTDDNDGGDLIPADQLPSGADLAKQGEAFAQGQAQPGDEPAEQQPQEAESPEAPASAEAPVEKPEVPLQPAPVEGETPREKALRLEVQRLRGLTRKKQVEDLVETTQQPQVTAEDEYQVLKDQGYTDDEIKKMVTAVDLIASKKGYVRADRNYAQSVQDTVDLFVEGHPEYKPSNDPDNLRWDRFQALLADGTYNLAGKTPKQLTSIFNKVDEDVRKELGENVIKTTPQQVAAARHKVAVVSHTGGGKPTPAEKPTYDPEQPIGGVKFKGFDEDDFKN